MDPIKNPFSPGAGSPPPELVGRDGVIEQARILLGRVKQRRPEKSMLLTGLRGVGKTVLLNEIEHMAESQGYHTVSVEAHEEKPLASLIALPLREMLYRLNRTAGTSDKVKRALMVLRSFLGAIKLSVENIIIEWDIDPEKGTADSGDLEIDLPALFVAVAEAAADRHSAVAIFIDEVQYFSGKELGSLIMAMHKIQQRQLPFVLVGAGLPVLPRLAGNSKSYAERLLSFPDIGALSEFDASRALSDPAKSVGVNFEPDALTEIFHLTRGFPYFVQEWGYQTWNIAESKFITRQVVQRATDLVIPRLDANFFRVRYERLTPAEKTYLRAMAELDFGARRTSDIAEKLQVKVTSLGPVRGNLIKKGMIYSPAHGDMAFTVPLFDEFMKRAIPEFKP